MLLRKALTAWAGTVIHLLVTSVPVRFLQRRCILRGTFQSVFTAA